MFASWWSTTPIFMGHLSINCVWLQCEMLFCICICKGIYDILMNCVHFFSRITVKQCVSHFMSAVNWDCKLWNKTHICTLHLDIVGSYWQKLLSVTGSLTDEHLPGHFQWKDHWRWLPKIVTEWFIVCVELACIVSCVYRSSISRVCQYAILLSNPLSIIWLL